jgi:catechol 2,3-dioxygenase-like lactoylglutathione lyase family enzyme
MSVRELDHLVLTVQDLQRTVAFYTRHLGMEAVSFDDGRQALHFGIQKINLHPADAPRQPHAAHPTPGSADLCFIVDEHIEAVAERLRRDGVAIELGPVRRAGAEGPVLSIYLRDPDGNLIELASPESRL